MMLDLMPRHPSMMFEEEEGKVEEGKEEEGEEEVKEEER
jgi:hypothetical protein